MACISHNTWFTCIAFAHSWFGFGLALGRPQALVHPFPSLSIAAHGQREAQSHAALWLEGQGGHAHMHLCLLLSEAGWCAWWGWIHLSGGLGRA